MRHKIEIHDAGLDIEIADATEKKAALLEAFQACQEGRCGCPTEEYSKLESLTIEADGDAIKLHLKSKSGEAFDESEISKCLQYTEDKLK
ncbi:hypothetical protein [Sedimenticola sp.]|uniref:hypothetical protein n=1 Tax=Sedimenticola sp. TaxID=1940285 RepID=UPI003D12405A